MQDIKLPLLMQKMLVDSFTLIHTGENDDWGNAGEKTTYEVTKVRLDLTAGFTTGKSENVRYSSLYLVYADYSLFNGEPLNIDLTSLATNDHWLIEVNGEPRTVVNVNIVRQPFSNKVFAYEIEVA